MGRALHQGSMDDFGRLITFGQILCCIAVTVTLNHHFPRRILTGSRIFMGKGAAGHQVFCPYEGFLGQAFIPFQPAVFGVSQTKQVMRFVFFMRRGTHRGYHERGWRERPGLIHARTREKECHNSDGKPKSSYKKQWPILVFD
jgi:hypothetical protein